jgi:hypothetical protein
VNRLSDRGLEPATLVPVDPERHALEARIEHAKNSIVEDLNRAGSLLREVAARTGRGIGRGLLAAGVVVAGAVLFGVLWWQRRRARLAWRWK